MKTDGLSRVIYWRKGLHPVNGFLIRKEQAWFDSDIVTTITPENWGRLIGSVSNSMYNKGCMAIVIDSNNFQISLWGCIYTPNETEASMLTIVHRKEYYFNTINRQWQSPATSTN